MPEIGEQVYYQNGPNGYPQSGYVVGQSSRSWFLGGSPNPWWAVDISCMRKHGLRYDKREIIFITEDVYRLARWAAEHRNKIKDKLDFIKPEQLKKVAEVIGYTE